ncbi:MAG: hypothetical protein AB1830_14110 [Pseudomonadota bacterium]
MDDMESTMRIPARREGREPRAEAAEDLIERLAEAIAQRVSPPIPLQVDLWSAEEIAAYLKVGRRQVLERYAPLPGFPRAIRLPAPGGGQGHPRWRAAEVIAWAERHKEGARGRRGRPREEG